MKFAFLSDPHILWDSPSGRLDNTRLTALDKFVFVLKWCQQNKAVLSIAGDFTNIPRSWRLLPVLMKILKIYWKVKIFAVYGQHDTYLYSEKTRPNTMLGVFENAGLVKILGSDPTYYPAINLKHKKAFAFYGCHYEKGRLKIPKPKNSADFNILVIHAPITKRALWHSQKYMDAKKFLVEHESYDIIHCGDIHRTFFLSHNGRTILNSGPMVRLTAEKYSFQHMPSFFWYDSNGSFGKVQIPHKPADEVLTRDHIERKATTSLDTFIKDLKSAGISKGFVINDVLWKIIKVNNLDQDFVDEMSSIIEEAEIGKK